MTTVRRAAAWLWPTQPRHPEYATLAYCLRGFVLKAGVLLALGFFLFCCWHESTRAGLHRDEHGNITVVDVWCYDNPTVCQEP